MAVIGDVVWFNSGQGPFTVIDLQNGHVIISQGNQGALQTVPDICVTTTNPGPQMDYDRQTLVTEIAAKVVSAQATPAVQVLPSS